MKLLASINANMYIYENIHKTVIKLLVFFFFQKVIVEKFYKTKKKNNFCICSLKNKYIKPALKNNK